jgi:hypothetical protein
MEQTELEDGIDTTGNGDVGDGRDTIGVGPENECSLKIMTTWHNQRRDWSKGNIAKIQPTNLPRCSRVPLVELHNKFWGKHLCGGLPRVCFMTETLPLDEVLKSLVVRPAVNHFFDFPLLFSLLHDWCRQWNDVVAFNGVLWSSSELHNIEDRVELLHGVWKAELIGIWADLLVNSEGTKAVV